MLGRGSELTAWRICHEMMSLKRPPKTPRSHIQIPQDISNEEQDEHTSSMLCTLCILSSRPLSENVLAGLIG